MLCGTWVGVFFTFSLLAFDIAMKGMTGISEVREYFGFLYNKKYFYVISMVGVFGRGLSSDKQPVNAACKGCSDLSQQELPGEEKQVRKTKHLQPLTLLGMVCVYLKPQLGLLFEKVARG